MVEKCARGSVPVTKLTLSTERCAGKKTKLSMTPEGVVKWLSTEYGCSAQEYFVVLHIDPRGTVLHVQEIAQGGLDSTAVDPRVVFAGALAVGASAMILVHNHPSQNLEPSAQDIALTETIARGAKLLNIRVLDHIIIGSGGWNTSMMGRGLARQAFSGLGGLGAPVGGLQYIGTLPPVRITMNGGPLDDYPWEAMLFVPTARAQQKDAWVRVSLELPREQRTALQTATRLRLDASYVGWLKVGELHQDFVFQPAFYQSQMLNPERQKSLQRLWARIADVPALSVAVDTLLEQSGAVAQRAPTKSSMRFQNGNTLKLQMTDPLWTRVSVVTSSGQQVLWDNMGKTREPEEVQVNRAVERLFQYGAMRTVTPAEREAVRDLLRAFRAAHQARLPPGFGQVELTKPVEMHFGGIAVGDVFKFEHFNAAMPHGGFEPSTTPGVAFQRAYIQRSVDERGDVRLGFVFVDSRDHRRVAQRPLGVSAFKAFVNPMHWGSSRRRVTIIPIQGESGNVYFTTTPEELNALQVWFDQLESRGRI